MDDVTRNEELADLVRDQKRDDSMYQDPQRLGGERMVSFDKFIDAGRDGADDLETTRQAVDRSSHTVGDVGVKRPAWKPNPIRPARPRVGLIERERQDLADTMTLARGSLTAAQFEATQLKFFHAMSEREAAAVFGIRQSSFQSRVTGALRGLREWLSAKFIPEEMQFEDEWEGRDLETRPRTVCRVEDCITVLSKYNPYANVCWVHAQTPTRARYVRDVIVGRA